MADDLTPSAAVLYGELKGRVQGLENSLRDLRTDIERQFESLSKNVERLNVTVIEASRPKWLIITSFASLFFGLMVGMWVVVISPLRSDIDRLSLRHDAFVDKTDAEFKTTMSQSMVSDLKAEMKAKIEELNTKIDQLNKRGR